LFRAHSEFRIKKRSPVVVFHSEIHIPHSAIQRRRVS
jgi:hypothetical protein